MERITKIKTCRRCGKTYIPHKFDGTSVLCPECRKDEKTTNKEKYERVKQLPPNRRKYKAIYSMLSHRPECKNGTHFEYLDLFHTLAIHNMTEEFMDKWRELDKRYVFLRDTYVYGLHRGDGFMVTEEEWYKELTPENIPSIEAFEHWLDVIEKGEE